MERRAFIAGVAAGFGLVGGCLSPIQVDNGNGNRMRQTEHRTHDVGSETSLRVHNRNGPVTVRGHEETTATLDIEIRGPTERSIEAVSVKTDRSDNRLTVTTKYDQTDAERVDVSLLIGYPNGAPIERLQTNNGAIKVRDTAGDPKLASQNGSLSVKNVDGTVALSTNNGSIVARDIGGLRGATASNGSIEIDVPSISNDVAVHTDNGRIDAALARHLNATVTATTTHTPIDLHDIALTDDGPTTVSGTLGKGTHTLTFETNNGSIDLRRLSA
ncbi:DUF4097 family beta strand repeat-containing protein [Halocatena pleomorpha]|uniref:Uncharacterized protein n=1 Tax=Halocatena pleomorpha TaxID=1785090 RepID=A0A3P3RF87_9EURY|nr:DUF4097 family beta strand repeat-containing protein [Halocatena pleomorpha]RRJ32024.1 hypothetical protein EIK79_05720 [Halocatena pleomorpha]